MSGSVDVLRVPSGDRNTVLELDTLNLPALDSVLNAFRVHDVAIMYWHETASAYYNAGREEDALKLFDDAFHAADNNVDKAYIKVAIATIKFLRISAGYDPISKLGDSRSLLSEASALIGGSNPEVTPLIHAAMGLSYAIQASTMRLPADSSEVDQSRFKRDALSLRNQALEEYQKASLTPEGVVGAAMGRIGGLISSGESREGCRMLQKFLRETPAAMTADSRLWLGRLLGINGKTELGRTIAEQATTASNTSGYAHLIRTNTKKFKTVGAAKEAAEQVAALVEALKTRPTHSGVLTLTDLLLALKRVPEAAALLDAHFPVSLQDSSLPRVLRDELNLQRARIAVGKADFSEALARLADLAPLHPLVAITSAQAHAGLALSFEQEAAALYIGSEHTDALARAHTHWSGTLAGINSVIQGRDLRVLSPVTCHVLAGLLMRALQSLPPTLEDRDRLLRTATELFGRCSNTTCASLLQLAARTLEIRKLFNWQIDALDLLKRAKAALVAANQSVPVELHSNLAALQTHLGFPTAAAEDMIGAITGAEAALAAAREAWMAFGVSTPAVPSPDKLGAFLESLTLAQRAAFASLRKATAVRATVGFVNTLFFDADGDLRTAASKAEGVSSLLADGHGGIDVRNALLAQQRRAPVAATLLKLEKSSHAPADLKLELARLAKGDSSMATEATPLAAKNPRAAALIGIRHFSSARKAEGMTSGEVQRKALHQAILSFSEALETCPSNAAALNGLAASVASLGDLDTALGLWRELLAQQVSGLDSQVNSNLAHAYHHRATEKPDQIDPGYAQKSTRHYLTSIALRPASSQTWQGLARLLTSLGETGSSVMTRLQQRRPWDLRVQWNAALLRTVEVEKAFIAACKLSEHLDAKLSEEQVFKLLDPQMWAGHRTTLQSCARLATRLAGLSSRYTIAALNKIAVHHPKMSKDALILVDAGEAALRAGKDVNSAFEQVIATNPRFKSVLAEAVSRQKDLVLGPDMQPSSTVSASIALCDIPSEAELKSLAAHWTAVASSRMNTLMDRCNHFFAQAEESRNTRLAAVAARSAKEKADAAAREQAALAAVERERQQQIELLELSKRLGVEMNEMPKEEGKKTRQPVERVKKERKPKKDRKKKKRSDSDEEDGDDVSEDDYSEDEEVDPSMSDFIEKSGSSKKRSSTGDAAMDAYFAQHDDDDDDESYAPSDASAGESDMEITDEEGEMSGSGSDGGSDGEGGEKKKLSSSEKKAAKEAKRAARKAEKAKRKEEKRARKEEKKSKKSKKSKDVADENSSPAKTKRSRLQRDEDDEEEDYFAPAKTADNDDEAESTQTKRRRVRTEEDEE